MVDERMDADGEMRLEREERGRKRQEEDRKTPGRRVGESEKGREWTG